VDKKDAVGSGEGNASGEGIGEKSPVFWGGGEKDRRVVLGFFWKNRYTIVLSILKELKYEVGKARAHTTSDLP
jgi:hypothetical protein